jgi:FlaA1/EpsC-like NDP-sugar epimerase
MRYLFELYKPHLVFHAAAYKHVPILQSQPHEALNNNVLGTKTILDIACDYNADKFVLISTDKAVNPSNILGVSKRIAELYTESMNHINATQCVTVRFGNVLDSAGSVVPLFKKQIKKGGPVTVTHPEITRYFMTIAEATQLILQAASMGAGGEIFVLDMGEPVKIQYLAEQMILLSGKKLGDDIDISYCGLRPGEKLYEELFYHSEKQSETTHQKIFLAKHSPINASQYVAKIDSFLEDKADDLSQELTACMFEFLDSCIDAPSKKKLDNIVRLKS